MASTSTSTRKGKKGKGAKAAPFRGGTPGHTALIKNSLQLSTNSSAIAGVIDVLRGQLAALDDEIKSDRKGVRSYEIELERLAAQRQDAEDHLERSRAWAAQFDTDIGPFQAKYEQLREEIKKLYSNAKKEHAQGVDVLIDAFEYHPAFKRFSDKFRGVPFRPK